jgi:hypothetical protein
MSTLTSDWSPCRVKTSRMKGPCALPKAHLTHPAYSTQRSHRGKLSQNENTPRLTQFRHVVEVGLEHGVRLSYAEIAELMGMNVRGVMTNGPGARYTRIRQRIYREWPLALPRRAARTEEQSIKIIADMRRVL